MFITSTLLSTLAMGSTPDLNVFPFIVMRKRLPAIRRFEFSASDIEARFALRLSK